MRPRTPIAIVGRGCVLPGALDPAALWTRVVQGDDLTSASTVADWGLHPSTVCVDPIEPSASARGGYVTGFDEIWRIASGARLRPMRDADAVPAGWKWLAVASEQALREASIAADLGARGGLIVGNLGYPTRELCDLAARRWIGELAADGPALRGQTGALHWVADMCGLAGPRLSLDAACASGLYALKIACDVLEAGRADVMLAGGLNASDDLFLHIGFTALGALSPSGRSAPLSARADGLLPACGAAVVALKRLDDALAAGDRVYAVVRGIGLSNQGRAAGLLAPAAAEQQMVMRAAYACSGLSPLEVDYLECHATGTPIGDREEVRAIRAVFADHERLRLGALKAQLGHLITASASAALLKICSSFEHATLPPAPQTAIDDPIEEIRASGLHLADHPEPWQPAAHPRRAGINAFGFGGCNAHVVLDGPEAADDLARSSRGATSVPVSPRETRGALALVACDVSAGVANNTDAVLRVLLGLDPPTRRLGELELPMAGLGVPPADLAQALPQQLLLLRAAGTLKPHLMGIDGRRLGIFIGTDVDPAAARHGLRRRLDAMLGRPCRDEERDRVAPPLQAAYVVGTMPNMPANRLNHLIDARGPGLVVSDGAASGRRALELAADFIARSELDAALVGAVDASGGAFGDDPSRTAAAVLLLLIPIAAAPAETIAILEPDEGDRSDELSLPWSGTGCARDLLQIAIAAFCCRHALLPSNPAQPWIAPDRVARLHGWKVRSTRVQGLAVEAPMLEAMASTAEGRSADEPVCGDLAWVFTGAAAAYPGAGRPLLRAIPELGDALFSMAPRLARSIPALLAKSTLSLVEQLQVATALSQMHAHLLERAGVRPDACLGLSSGETNALLATGAWSDADDLFADIERSGMYDEHLAGRHRALRRAWALEPDEKPSWRCYRVAHSVADLRAAIESRPRVRLLVVHHAADAVIGGDARACRDLIESLGASAVPIDHDLVVHCPELEPFAETWYRVHHRRTRAIASPRLYANALNGPYEPSANRCAEVLTAQARETVIFDATVRRTFDDGVRQFVELGPRAACTGWIDEILADRPHTACALDGSRGSLSDITRALTTLMRAGCRVDVDWWNQRMRDLRLVTSGRVSVGAGVRLPGHRPQPSFDSAPAPEARLLPAPSLAPILPERMRAARSTAEVDGAAVTGAAAAIGIAQAPPSALAALAACQQALVRAQAIAISQMAVSTAVAPPLTMAPPPIVQAPQVLSFTRAQLEVHASGRIASLFGPLFEKQASYARQVRMPMPPLLLADRMTSLEGTPGSMALGRVQTETDVVAGAWYLHHGRVPAGIVIEAGQADLLLISWLGVDLHNRDARVYRLLGCELTFHGGLPAIGETLHYDIAIEGHARHGDVGLFFFRSDCTSSNGTPRLTVRHGQAGFFTDTELAESAGVLWQPEDDEPPPDAPLAGARPGIVPASSYDAEHVRAFSDGDAMRAFGRSFARCASHTRTPCIPPGHMQLFERVEMLDPEGGPWKRGYLRAVLPIAPDTWFFEGHFFNDPCMPGTLMLEGCLQAMSFYLAALGYAIDRDGWRFEPVPEQPYLLRCRGQVTPQSRELVYEVFVAELHDGPEPMLVADVMGTVDSLRAFHCRRMALRLTPDAPLGPYALSQVAEDPEPVAEYDGFTYGQASLLACAIGDPVAAFGPLFASFPATRRVPRLPGPPYHFVSRVLSVSDSPGCMRAGIVAETAFDLDPDAWYFTAHPSHVMPAGVLIEAALQPCGWLAAYIGCVVNDAEELFFRNLDGSGVLHRSIRSDDGCLRFRSRLRSISAAGGMTLVSFDVTGLIRGEVVYELDTTFGFFPRAALAGQTGLGADDRQRELAEPRDDRDLLADFDARAFRWLPQPPLRMYDRVTDRRVESDGRAVLRADKAVQPGEWFFRAHFFQDPVQPGSLGVDALVQLLQAHLVLEGAPDAFPDGTFTDVVGPGPAIWKLRGQVLPESALVTLTLEAEPIQKAPDGWSVKAEGSVWVDGLRIYHARGLSVSVHPPARAKSADLIIERAEAWWHARDWQSRVPELRALFVAACRRFVREVRLVDRDAIAARHGGPVLLLANHQVAIESMLAGILLPPAIGRPLTILAKEEHRRTWVGGLGLGLNDDRHGPSIVFVDRERQQEMIERLAEMQVLVQSGRRSLMVHVEGTRASRGGQPVETISAVWSDLAVRAGMTVVPLRFCGGLPATGVPDRLDFPFGLGALDLIVGRPIEATELAALHVNGRRERILAGLAELEAFDREPIPDLRFLARVRAARDGWDLDELRSVFLLLQAEARGWRLDAEGLPAAAMSSRRSGDPFWAWFESRTEGVER